MAFKLGDIIIDRLQYGYAESLDAAATPLYVLTQLSEATIEITAESTDVTDARGNLVKKIWQSKAGTLNAQNAFINTNIVAAASGVDPVFATEDDKITMPAIKVFKAGETPEIKDLVAGTLHVTEFTGDGSLGKKFELGAAASDTEFFFDEETNTLNLPTDETVDQYIVRYDRDVTDGVKLSNSSDKFPKSCRLLLKALYFDPCQKNELKSCYIELPSFQISPEVSLPINSEGQMDFTGDLEIDYCGLEKVLYNIYFANDIED